MIRVENLVYKYPGKTALDDVSFTIEPGAIMALVGPNGAGKTTLLRCIAALDDPFSGKIHVAGIDVDERPREVHSVLGYLSDFFGVYSYLSVRQCLIFAGKLHGIDGERLNVAIQKTAEMLSLTPYLDQKASSLSRGWRQRLGIAQAVIHRPKLLLLDEPASGLDPEARLELSSLMRQLQGEGMTLVVSSHVLAELEDYCTEMLVLREGRLVQHCPAGSGTVVGGAKAHSVIDVGVIGDTVAVQALLASLPGVEKATLSGQVIHIEFSGAEDGQHQLLKKLIEGGVQVTSFAPQKIRLQDVYMSLSKRATNE